jgi:hypothetical protein
MSLPMKKSENTTTYVKPVAKTEPVQLNVFRKPELTVEERINLLTTYAENAPDPLEGVNKLYFMSVKEKTSYYKDIDRVKDGSIPADKLGAPILKIGDTKRLVKTRNAESITNASLHLEMASPWYIANKDGKEFRDHDFHKFLEGKEYERELNENGTPSEFFFITLEQALEELELFCQKPVFETAVLRNAQNYLLELEQKAIDLGFKYINADYCMRSGKTILSLQIAKNNNWMPVYLGKNLTSQNSADQDNDEYGIVPHMTTESLHGPDDEDLADDEVSGKVKKIIDSIDSENKLNQKLAFYVDEADDGSHTKISCDVIVAVVTHYKKTGQFAFFKSMTGTRSHLGMKILNKVADGRPIKELSLAYWQMQILQPETTCIRNYRNISFYREDASGFTSISDAFKNKREGHKSLATAIAGLLDSANNYKLYENADYPHWFMKFATGGDVKGTIKFVNYLNKVYKNIEGVDYVYHAINSTTTSNSEAEKDCKKVIKDNPGKIVVFITQGMATTSFSVTGIGNSVVFSDNPLRADDVQALHRSATWTPGKVECNMIRVTTNASNDFDWDSPFEDDLSKHKSRDSKKRLYRQLLRHNSMIHFVEGEGFSYQEITEDDIEDVIDKKMKSLSTIASMVMILVDTADEDMLNLIYHSDLNSKSTNKKSGTDKGDKIDPFNKGDTSSKPKGKKMGQTAKEKKLKAFVEAVRNVPAIAREQETTMEEFDCWDDIDISKEMFFKAYNTSLLFQDQVDSIFNLCEDDSHLKTYLDNL